jgi:hypothetical protein
MHAAGVRLPVAAWCAVGLIALGGFGLAASQALGGKKLKTKTAATNLAEDEADSVTAKCGKGQKALSGGWETEHALGQVALAYQSQRDGGRKWTTSAFNTALPADLTSIAYCRKGAKVKSFTESTEVGPGPDSGSVTAKCPKGTRAVSGGFANPDAEVTGPVQTLILPYESRREGKREWVVSGQNTAAGDGTLIAQVNCAKGIKAKEVSSTLGSGGPIVDGALRATCKRGQAVISGGFGSNEPDSIETDGPLVFGSLKAGKRSWDLLVATIDPTLDFTAYAYCQKK